MRILLLLALGVSSLALAQPVKSGGGGGIKANCPTCVLTDLSLTLTATTGSMALNIVEGSFIYLDGATAKSSIANETTNHGMVLVSNGTNNTTVRGFKFNTVNTLNSGGGRYFDFQNNGTSVMFMDTGNTLNIAGNASSSTAGNASFGSYSCTSATSCGTSAFSAATTKTVVVVSGCHPLCTNNTSTSVIQCAVSSTTLTATESGASSDSFSYFCF